MGGTAEDQLTNSIGGGCLLASLSQHIHFVRPADPNVFFIQGLILWLAAFVGDQSLVVVIALVMLVLRVVLGIVLVVGRLYVCILSSFPPLYCVFNLVYKLNCLNILKRVSVHRPSFIPLRQETSIHA